MIVILWLMNDDLLRPKRERDLQRYGVTISSTFKSKLVKIIFRNSLFTSKKTHYLSTTKIC